ncbi:MAG: hypothetical protein HDR31_00300 [Mycoplasma sp.]|nr:hypothetical protein [Mycoplasma sp.]
MLFFSFIYYYKNKKKIISEYDEIFSFINLNNFFWSKNKYSNSVLYVKQWINNVVYILISGVIVGVIYTILKNNGINITPFPFLIDFSIFFIVPMIFVYIICSFLQGFAGYKFYKEELINKKTFLTSCIPIANLFSFMFL